MATLKQRLHRKNASGAYDVVYMETSADMVLMSDGKTKLSSKISAMDTTIAGKAASSHTHPAQTTITGNAGSATKLATARTIRTNLASTTAASFNGTANITPGVTGILPVANGGTGTNSLANLKTAIVSEGGGAAGASYNLAGIVVGALVWFNNAKWRCVHKTGSTYYLMLELMEERCIFGTSTVYKGSTLAAACLAYQNRMAPDSLAKCQNWTVEGVTQKVNSLTYAQVFNRQFAYFDADESTVAIIYARHGYSYLGTEVPWWLATKYDASGKSYSQAVDGANVKNVDPSATYYVRPAVAITL